MRKKIFCVLCPLPYGQGIKHSEWHRQQTMCHPQHSTALLKRQRSVIWELSSSNCFGQNVPIYRWKYDCSHRKIKIPKVHVFFGQKIKKSPFSGPKTKTKFGWALVHDSNITQSTGVYLHATANIVVLHPILVQILPAAPACTHKQWQI